ncbi:hypothetical protein CZ787_13340 [Halomonas citrativorans]|uniref:Uncharacterized protein n=1 Tax=Halomonas citrativorans TaxID=2742612 RepID=A0A1R4I2U6_9GAMM|nr:hypothetical protein [Halomonas citrativorans]SJN14078.1 hypothetical protein CZ787_13340 [Halomonas citrativorans]
MAEKFTEFDPAAMLESCDDIAVFMSDALETGNAAYVVKALGIVDRARSMSEIVCESELSQKV